MMNQYITESESRSGSLGCVPPNTLEVSLYSLYLDLVTDYHCKYDKVVDLVTDYHCIYDKVVDLVTDYHCIYDKVVGG